MQTTNRKATLAIVAAGALTALVGASAWAGQRLTSNVSIDTGDREAAGSVGSARNSSDSTQYIGCRVSSGLSAFESASCFARNTAGTTVTCFTTNPTAVHILGQVGSTSRILFSWDTAGTCTDVTVINSSQYAPMNP